MSEQETDRPPAEEGECSRLAAVIRRYESRQQRAQVVVGVLVAIGVFAFIPAVAAKVAACALFVCLILYWFYMGARGVQPNDPSVKERLDDLDYIDRVTDPRALETLIKLRNTPGYVDAVDRAVARILGKTDDLASIQWNSPLSEYLMARLVENKRYSWQAAKTLMACGDESVFHRIVEARDRMTDRRLAGLVSEGLTEMAARLEAERQHRHLLRASDGVDSGTLLRPPTNQETAPEQLLREARDE